MQRIHSQFKGVELYFDDLQRAKKFYEETLSLPLSDEQIGHHARFDSGAGFICLERKGAESYPSKDKAVLFFEVADLRSAVAAIGPEAFVQIEPTWAVLHDPEGHNVLLVETSPRARSRSRTRGLPVRGSCVRGSSVLGGAALTGGQASTLAPGQLQGVAANPLRI